MLHCKHIFCEECVATWFDRDTTCPMCRWESGARGDHCQNSIKTTIDKNTWIDWSYIPELKCQRTQAGEMAQLASSSNYSSQAFFNTNIVTSSINWEFIPRFLSTVIFLFGVFYKFAFFDMVRVILCLPPFGMAACWDNMCLSLKSCGKKQSFRFFFGG